jgi:hypothetical protein
MADSQPCKHWANLLRTEGSDLVCDCGHRIPKEPAARRTDAALRDAVEALEKYGDHGPDCKNVQPVPPEMVSTEEGKAAFRRLYDSGYYACDCGFDAALTALRSPATGEAQ